MNSFLDNLEKFRIANPIPANDSPFLDRLVTYRSTRSCAEPSNGSTGFPVVFAIIVLVIAAIGGIGKGVSSFNQHQTEAKLQAEKKASMDSYLAQWNSYVSGWVNVDEAREFQRNGGSIILSKNKEGNKNFRTYIDPKEFRVEITDSEHYIITPLL
jgi:hypothetical protein